MIEPVHRRPPPDDDLLSARRPGTYVPALPAQPAHQVAPYSPQLPALDVPAPIVETVDDGRHAVTRARAFALRTGVLAGGLAMAMATLTAWGLSAQGAGAAFVGAVVVLFVVFSVTWGAGLWLDISRSPGGIAYKNVDRMWNVIDREQVYRHQADWYERTKQHEHDR